MHTPKFSIERKQFANQEVIQVSTADQSTWFSVFPRYGGALHELVSRHQPLLETAYDRASWVLRTQNAFAGAQLCPFPNRIRGGVYRWEGQSYQLATNDPAAPNALHGIVYHQHLEEIAADAENGSLVLGLEYNGDVPGYPFPFRLENTYQLVEDGLLVKTNITNRAEHAIPMGHGWHPYFSVGSPIDTAQFQTSASLLYPTDANYIPTGEALAYHQFKKLENIGNYAVDHCFKADQQEEKARLYFPSKGITLKVMSQRYDYLQVYIPEHRKSLAIEPQSCLPDAFNNAVGLVTLSPKESVVFDMRLVVEHE